MKTNVNVMVKDNSFYKVSSTALIIIFLMVSAFFVSAQQKAGSEKTFEEIQSLLEQEKFDKALALLNKEIKRSKSGEDLNRFLYARAYVYYTIDDIQKSLADVSQVLTNNPDFIEARVLRAELYSELQDYDKGLADLSLLIEKHADVSLVGTRANMAIEAGQYALGRQDIKTLLMYNPTPELETYLGYAYYLDGDLDSALLVYTTTLEKYPEQVDTYFYAGIVHYEQGDTEQALTYFNKGLALNPDHLYLLFYKGIVLVEEETTNQEGCRCLNRVFYQGVDDAADYLKEYCFGKP